MLTKYVQGASKSVCNRNTGEKSGIYVYELGTNQQSTVGVIQDEQNPTKVVRASSTTNQVVDCFFDITGHVVTVALEKRRR